MSGETVRLEYLGKNKGAIPWRGVSGRVYRAAAVTHRFVDVLPEDVPKLLRTGKFKVIRGEKPVIDENLDKLDFEIRQKQGQESEKTETVQDAPEGAETESLDVSTIAALETALEGAVTLEALHDALELEQNQEKPRKGIVKLLQDAIDDFGNTGNV